MKKELQQEFINLIRQYEETDRNTVKNNLRKYLDDFGYSHTAEHLNINIQTVYHWTKKQGNRPSLLTALQLCELFDINIDELMKE